MSPQTAQSKKVGDHVARRGFQDHTDFTHVGVIVKTTKHAIYARFFDSPRMGTRYAFGDSGDMAALRTADKQETVGYKRRQE